MSKAMSAALPSLSPDACRRALMFAALAHQGQSVSGGGLPYIIHPGAVAMEVMAALTRQSRPVDADLAIICALLHDVIEDTAVTEEQVRGEFGAAVAAGVSALSKNPSAGDKRVQMLDSLERIRQQPREVWMVKLADRITNLQPPPPHWRTERIRIYHEEALRIRDALAPADEWLANRLGEKIQDYRRYF